MEREVARMMGRFDPCFLRRGKPVLVDGADAKGVCVAYRLMSLSRLRYVLCILARFFHRRTHPGYVSHPMQSLVVESTRAEVIAGRWLRASFYSFAMKIAMFCSNRSPSYSKLSSVVEGGQGT